MITRIWHGWTEPQLADDYQQLLDTEIVPAIIGRAIAGLRRVDVLRRCEPTGDEVEFVTVMTFDDWSAVEAFAGRRVTDSVVPAAARPLLRRFDEHSQHYDLVTSHVNRAADPTQ